ncbi:MAG: DUF4390 domain-containing protein [Pseudomonadota bacterium]
MRCQFLQQLLPRATTRTASGLLRCWLALCLGLALLLPPGVQAQAVELKQLQLQRRDGELTLEFSARLTLGPSIEDALQRGVPLYFNARATVYRDRWYWRDERVARVSRTWRLAYQPLTASWRLSLGGLSQGYPSLSEAMAPLSQVSGWRLVELDKLEPGSRYHVEFSFNLDNSQLPQPMQIDLGGDWKLGIERSLRLE